MEKATLNYLYSELGKSDSEIAAFVGLDRTALVKMRQKFSIETRLSTGRIGELKVIERLTHLFGKENVIDMNNSDATSEYDILLNGTTRIEVKSSRQQRSNSRYHFTFSNAEKVGVRNTERVIVTATNRTIKKMEESCDFVILVLIDSAETDFLIVPSNDSLIKGKLTLSTKSADRHPEFKNRWDLL